MDSIWVGLNPKQLQPVLSLVSIFYTHRVRHNPGTFFRHMPSIKAGRNWRRDIKAAGRQGMQLDMRDLTMRDISCT
jgi:hypothetical protein